MLDILGLLKRDLAFELMEEALWLEASPKFEAEYDNRVADTLRYSGWPKLKSQGVKAGHLSPFEKEEFFNSASAEAKKSSASLSVLFPLQKRETGIGSHLSAPFIRNIVKREESLSAVLNSAQHAANLSRAESEVKKKSEVEAIMDEDRGGDPDLVSAQTNTHEESSSEEKISLSMFLPSRLNSLFERGPLSYTPSTGLFVLFNAASLLYSRLLADFRALGLFEREYGTGEIKLSSEAFRLSLFSKLSNEMAEDQEMIPNNYSRVHHTLRQEYHWRLGRLFRDQGSPVENLVPDSDSTLFSL